MKLIKDLFGAEYRKQPTTKRRTERGDLTDWIFSKLSVSWDSTKYGKLTVGYVRFRVSHIPTKDLYYIKNLIEDAIKREYPVGKVFFGSIKPQKQSTAPAS